MQKEMRDKEADLSEEHESENAAARDSQTLSNTPTAIAEELVTEPWWLMAALGFWPLLWVLGAALLRGGVSLHLSGLRLEQSDGRPAARWRCLLRSLLVWVPIYLLLLVSLLADLWRIAILAAEPDRQLGWLIWTSWVGWWLAVLLPIVYLWSGIRWPNRGLHDVLAGTYLVPR
jgi:hypothetical protein